MMRQNLIELLSIHENPVDAVDAIVDYLEDIGLSLSDNGWLDGHLLDDLTTVIRKSPDLQKSALEILAHLDDCLALDGNGWLDDDPEAVSYINLNY
ncbi:hypothetical protein ACI2KR_08995 [Pseudomonas luteola]